MDGDRLRFVTTDTERLVELERALVEHQAGPCAEAVRAGAVVAIVDLRTHGGRWPAYADAAASLGVIAAAGIPMRNGGRALGVLNLYDNAPRPWIDDDLDVAQSLADMATSYVLNASKLDQERGTSEQLQRALSSRIVIEQAKGILA